MSVHPTLGMPFFPASKSDPSLGIIHQQSEAQSIMDDYESKQIDGTSWSRDLHKAKE
jgi:hypothetical protein